MKLELKHYLDAFKYKVPFKITELGIFNMDLEYPDERYYDKGIITDLSTYNEGKEISGTLALDSRCYFDFDFKIDEEPEIIPCYRPLSDLKKEIERNKTFLHKIAIELGMLKDDNFIFEYDFSDRGSYGDKYDYSIISPNQNKIISVPQKTEKLKNVSCNVMEKLCEYHFDIFGLIEKGLAIDINTL